MTRAERRAEVKRAWVATGGAPNVSRLARQLGVSRGTVYRDIESIEAETVAIATLDEALPDRQAEAVAFYEDWRDWAKARALTEKVGGRYMHEAARVGLARLALDAQDRLCKLLGLNAPQRHQHEGEMLQTINVNIREVSAGKAPMKRRQEEIHQ